MFGPKILNKHIGIATLGKESPTNALVYAFKTSEADFLGVGLLLA